MFRLALIACLAPLPLFAQDCPASGDRTGEVSAIYDRLQSAPDERSAQALAQGLWAIWTDAPDARAQALLDKGMSARSSFNWPAAREALSELVDYCPDYAEGYNQRAFVAFLTGDFEAALVDLENALALDPRHVAAMSGAGLTLMRLGRDAEAQAMLRAALKLNPWLPERRFVTEPPGEDI